MKKLYWRPQRLSISVLSITAIMAVAGLLLVERYRVRQRQPYFAEKTQAARLCARAFDVVKKARLERGLPIDVETDPTQSGLIGELLSPVTTNPGHLPAKMTTINPNFAAVVVHLLKRAEVNEGDVVAVGMSGSFPAANVAVMAAIDTLKLKPIAILSAGASQWGANHAEFMWPDMEQVLHERRVFSFRSVAGSRGGIEDRALGLSRRGRQFIDNALARSSTPMLFPKDYNESVEQRMALFREHAAGAPIKAYINVGGGTTSVGTRVGKKMFKPGLNKELPPRVSMEIDSVMSRFSLDGVPVIHLSNIDEIATRYGLPLQPTGVPSVGEGKIFMREVYNIWLALAVLIVLLVVLFAFVRADWGYRILSAGRRGGGSSRPEPMV